MGSLLSVVDAGLVPLLLAEAMAERTAGMNMEKRDLSAWMAREGSESRGRSGSVGPSLVRSWVVAKAGILRIWAVCTVLYC